MSTCSEAPEEPAAFKLRRYQSPLCQICLALFLPLEAHPEEARVTLPGGDIVVKNVYHKRFETWDSAVKAGCQICCQVRDNHPTDVLELFAGNHTAPGVSIEYWSHSNHEFPNWILIYLDDDPRGRDELWRLELFPKLADSEPRNTFELRWAEVGAVSPTWDYIGRWIQTCTASHERCRPLSSHGSQSYHPTRLLDLGHDHRDGIRLIETAEEIPDGAYTTLSHRWGGTNPVLTVRENMEDFKGEIPLPLLSKTFRDAIQVTRRLGLRYIWIDSLCIIQNDASDWAQEAASMGRVYENAFCNLSASNNGDMDTEGLFLDDKRSLTPPIIVRCGDVDVEALDPRVPRRDIDDGPLQQRGWVFQERMLSPRILHFTRDQVYWECSEMYANELYPAGLLREVRGKDPLEYRLAGKAALLECAGDIDRPFPRDIPHETRTILEEACRCWFWTTVISWYSERALTYRSDILPALSGIAKHLAPLLGSTSQRYVAGMWRDQCMFAQLAWYTWSPSKAKRLPGPTWSWVTTDEPIRFITYMWSFASPLAEDSVPEWTRRVQENPIKSCKVLDAQATLATADPTGAVNDAFVLLQGHMNGLILSPGEIPGCLIGGGPEPVPMELYFDRDDDDTGPLFLFSLYVVSLDVGAPGSQEELHPHPAYLILSPVQGRPGTYERRGLARWRWFRSDRVEPPWKTVPGQDIPSEGPFDEEVGYTIRVV